MKKQNKFKTPDIKYDPIEQPKLPLWMHSIERPVNKKEIRDMIISFILLATMACMSIVALMVLEG